MKVAMHLHTILLFCGLLSDAVGSFVGINIGTDVSNPPSATDIVEILKAHQITHVRLFNADARMLSALSNTNIEVMVSVTNDEILKIGRSPSEAAAWINRNVAAYVPTTNITAIAVGSEVLTSTPNIAPVLAAAMNNLHKALVAANVNYLIKVSTPHSMGVIPQPFPPSAASFNTSWNSIMSQILQFLINTNSFYMLNAYPYYEYVKSNGIFPLEYALFEPLSSARQLVDPNTLFHYSNMFDALIDAAYNSIAALNFSGIPVVVTETGWPWSGEANEPDATVENAETYNNNLIDRVLNDSGPPSQPGIPISAYIYEMFNEDRRPGLASGRNWGVFFSNGSAVYDLKLRASETAGANSSTVFCVARKGADEQSLQNGLNYACGTAQVDCSAIQPGQPCYNPNTFENHASYAYNDYYQKMHSSGGTCDFNGTAEITSVDPSYGSCKFTGSSSSSNGGLFPPPALGPASLSSGGSRNLVNLGTVVAFICLLHFNVRRVDIKV